VTSEDGPRMTESVRAAMTETRRAGSSPEALRDAMLRDPAAADSRALAACGSTWRPAPFTEPSGPSPADLGSLLVWRVGLEGRAAEVFGPGGVGSVRPRTTGHMLFATLQQHPVVADELGVAPEAYLACLEAVLVEAPES
jgi:hypothetical protein